MRPAASRVVAETYRLNRGPWSVVRGPWSVVREPHPLEFGSRRENPIRGVGKILKLFIVLGAWSKDPRARIDARKRRKTAKNRDSRPTGGRGDGFGLVS